MVQETPNQTHNDYRNLIVCNKFGNILILKVSPLAEKSLDDVKEAISQLIEFTQTVGGDMARLGEERIVITPAFNWLRICHVIRRNQPNPFLLGENARARKLLMRESLMQLYCIASQILYNNH